MGLGSLRVAPLVFDRISGYAAQMWRLCQETEGRKEFCLGLVSDGDAEVVDALEIDVG